MPHDTPLITTIVAALVLAFIFGAIANRLKMPPLVGYLIAGIAVGPHSPGFIADQTLAPQLAEIGVILLMFGVGLHFSLRDLLSVKAVAIPGALVRLALSTGVGVALGMALGWPLLGGVVLGLAVGVSSTVVTLKSMQDRHLMDSDRGRIAIGWLVVEDLAMVLALVLIPALAGTSVEAAAAGVATAIGATPTDPFVALTEQLLHMHLPLWGVIAVTLVKLLAFVGFMIVVGRRIIPYILHATAHTGSRELFRLAVLAIALGVAAGAAYLFGVSLALGAFFAGMILSESELSQRAAQETLPLRDAFGVLFFVSVGMLFDPSIIVREPLPVLAVLAIILFGKSLVSFLLLVLFRRSVASALTISASLAQIGEFSFILAALGISLGVMPAEGQGLILAGAIISIILNPAMFWLSERLRPRLEAKATRRAEPELGPVVPDSLDQIAPIPAATGEGVLEEVAQPTRLSNHVVLVGYGRVGSVVAAELTQEGAPFVLIEDAEGRVLAAREAGIEVVVGNAATHETLTLANVMGARCVVIAIPNAFEAGQATEQCRKLNAAVRIIARAHSDEEEAYLKRLGADEVIMGEREIGLGMIDWLKGDGRREKAVAPPRFSAGENLLHQARGPRPAAAEDTSASGPVVIEPHEPILPPAAAVAPATTEAPAVAGAAATTVLPAARSIFSFARRTPPPLAEPIASADVVPPVEPAVAAAIEPSVAAASPEVSPSADEKPAPAAVIEAPAAPQTEDVVPVVREITSADESGGAAHTFRADTDRFVFPDGLSAASVAAVGPAAAPEAQDAVSAAASTPTFADALFRPTEATPATAADFEFPPRPGEAAARPETETAASSENLTTPEAEPAATAAESGPASAESVPNPLPGAMVEEDREPAPVEGPATGTGPSANFRVVPPSDIFILPPDPSARAGSWGETDEPVKEEPRPTFRSEFWGESAADGRGASTFAGATQSPPMRDVHASEAARAAVEDGSWMEALERDLFGGEPETPGPTPREDPAPSPQPIETPHPQEDPVPPPQPIEQPTPVEVPSGPPQPAQPPQPTADREDDEESADAFGRREPRLY